MDTSIIVVIISGIVTLLGTVLTVWASSRKTEHQIQVSQAITTTQVQELTREVREHNNFARRMPVVEEQIKVINHRIDDLEEAQKKG